MKILALDTSHHFLTIALIDDDHLIASLQKPAYKQQSETIMVEIDRLFKEVGWIPSDLKALVLTEGPGSYTGLRISMTIAKVLGLIQGIQLYTLSSLQLLSGTLENVYAVMDARANRVYLGHYKKGLAEFTDTIVTNEEAKKMIECDAMIVGDAMLVDQTATVVFCPQHFVDLKAYWKPVKNFHTLVPHYLKATDDYGV